MVLEKDAVGPKTEAAEIRRGSGGSIIWKEYRTAEGVGVFFSLAKNVPAAFLDRSEVESEIRQELAPLPMPLGGWDPAGVRARFGTYRGLVRLLLAEVENRSGNFRRFKQIRWESVKRAVFVCHGNICRSPYAARRAEAYGLTVASFGLSAGTGESADPSARRIAARRGVDLADHRAGAFGKIEVALLVRRDTLGAAEARRKGLAYAD